MNHTITGTGFFTTAPHGGTEVIPTGLIITVVQDTTIMTVIADAADITAVIITIITVESQVEAHLFLQDLPPGRDLEVFPQGKSQKPLVIS